MVRGRTVAATLLLLLIIAVVSALVLDVREEPGEGGLRFENVAVSAEEVRPRSLEGKVWVRFHRPSEVGAGSLEISIYDAATGLLVDEKKFGIPDDGVEGVSEVNMTLTLDRSSDYDLTFRLTEGGKVSDLERMRAGSTYHWRRGRRSGRVPS